MASMQRFNPIDELFNEFSKGFFVRPFAKPEGGEPKMKIDVREDANAYTVRAEIPGVRKEDIQVHVEGNGVTLRAEVKEENEQKDGERVIHSERAYGMVSRSFTLPGEVDPAGAKAQYRDGVLNLMLPKKPDSQTRFVSVT
jgi:HSP20 family protein